MSPAKLLFAGTPGFALASLRALHGAGYTPLAVLTQPDRPAGRGKRLTASPVKEFALEAGMPVWQPATLRDADAVARIEALQPDLMIVAAYGLLLPPSVLSLPRRGCVNVHASLLPRWRGAAPVQAAIFSGDAQSGISLMQMDEGLDTGPVLASAALDIDPDETAGSLHDRLARLGGEVLAARLCDILDGALEARPQDESLATYAGKIRKQDAAIDWRQPAGRVERQVRAFNPVPGASFVLGDETLRCWQAELVQGPGGPPGTVLEAGKDGVVVACGEGAVRLLEVQRPGRRRIRAAEWANQGTLGDRRLD